MFTVFAISLFCNAILMKILYIIALSFFSSLTLFILTKLMGNKQISQLTTFDYIIGITIGSIAAEMATSLEDDFKEPLTAMITYGIIAAILSVITNKSLAIRRFIDGKSMILYENGKLYKKNFTKARLNVNEFLTECRLLGYYNIADIQTAILEPNGRISVMPKASARPVTVSDMNITPTEEKPPVAIILDGKILKRNLKFTGNNEIWLKNRLTQQGVGDIKNIFFASCDNKNNLSVYTNIKEKPDYDIFS